MSYNGLVEVTQFAFVLVVAVGTDCITCNR